MKFFAVVVAFFSLQVTTVDISILEIRNAYKVCDQSKEHAHNFMELSEKGLKNKGAIYKGYYGAALALKASHSWNPISKMSYFNKARKTIDDAIESEPNNIELRMIRSTIQTKVPKFLGYYKNIEEDRDFMLNNVEKITTEDLKKYIKGYIAYSDIFPKS